MVAASRPNVLEPPTFGVLTIATTILVGIRATTAEAAHDYDVQSQQLAVMHPHHLHGAGR